MATSRAIEGVGAAARAARDALKSRKQTTGGRKAPGSGGKRKKVVAPGSGRRGQQERGDATRAGGGK
jgi:hypothetical protein